MSEKKKTRMEDFLERFPDAPMTKLGYPVACCHSLGHVDKLDCDHTDCYKCWHTLLDMERKNAKITLDESGKVSSVRYETADSSTFDLKSLRVENNIPAKDMVAIIKEIFPGYDKHLQSKCENPYRYGVKLVEEAEREIISRYGIVAPLKARTRDSHKLKCKVQCRLSESEYRELQQHIKADGFDTTQAFLTFMLRRYLKGEIKCHI